MPRKLAFALLCLSALFLLLSGAEDSLAQGSIIPCVSGFAGPYPCNNVNLLAHMPLDELGASDGSVNGNDHWAWIDSISGRQFVLFGLSNGTSFIEITDPVNPVYLGILPTHEGSSSYRDIKVHQDHAYIIADLLPNHGMQVFDLSQLLSVASPPVTFTETAHYDGFGPGHNLWINEASGFAYVLRTGVCDGTYMVDINTPTSPTFAGCFADDGEASDTQCVIYAGPDANYQDRELCFTGSDDTWTIADVTDKNAPVQIDSLVYPGLVRAHQGTLTADHRFWLLSDTMDEAMNGHNTRIYMWDLADLDNPMFLGNYEYGTAARDHNLYVNGHLSYQANWRAGLQILDISILPEINFNEVGFFDIVPESNSVDSTGAWSNYPWWGAGIVTVSGSEEGLFILQTALAPTDVSLTGVSGNGNSVSPWLMAITSLIFFGGFWHIWRKRQAVDQA